MQTLTAARVQEQDILLPVAIQLLVQPVDPEVIDVFDAQPRWEEPAYDEALEARCSSL